MKLVLLNVWLGSSGSLSWWLISPTIDGCESWWKLLCWNVLIESVIYNPRRNNVGLHQFVSEQITEPYICIIYIRRIEQMYYSDKSYLQIGNYKSPLPTQNIQRQLIIFMSLVLFIAIMHLGNHQSLYCLFQHYKIFWKISNSKLT